MVIGDNQREFMELLDYLKRTRGFDFNGYKHASLMRRIQKRMQMINIQQYNDYIDFLEVHPDEFTNLFNTILINMTGFFRDPAAWEYLRDTCLQQILNSRHDTDPIRVWSTGCASGEEAYTIAMLLSEALGEDRYREWVKIYGTDVDEDALNKARQAVYTQKEVEGVPAELLDRYFSRTDSLYSFSKGLRRNLIFGRNDLIQDAPISRIDLLICRNTLMYFNTETQSRILSRFHFALRDLGYLFLGKAEMLLTYTAIFTPIDPKLRIFKKVPRVNQADQALLSAFTMNQENNNGAYSTMHMREAAFEASPGAQVVVDNNSTLILINEQARILFGLSSRDISRPFQDLEISYCPIELRGSVQRVLTEHVPVLHKEVAWVQLTGEPRYYNVDIQPLFNSGNRIVGASIIFTDTTQQKTFQTQLEQANHELETAFEELQSTNEELETTNEELQSTNEELETTNEEQQSTNEELETMNEELQSTNEELQTINDELNQRTLDLNRVNAYLDSILSSMKSGVVVLDRNLQVETWNRQSENLWGLRLEEVRGQNFLNLDIGLPVEALKKNLRLCLSGDMDGQEVTLQGRDRRGRDIECKTIIAPLKDVDKTIQGAILIMEVE